MDHAEFSNPRLTAGVRTLGNLGSHIGCRNRVLETRLRHEVRDLDGQHLVHEHLLHDLLKEVFSLGVGAGLEHGLEVVDQGKDVRAIELTV